MTTGLDTRPAPATHELRRALGVSDLTLTQVLFIVGLPWVGVAAKQGPAHVLLWLAAILFFYVPSAVVVIHLNRTMPLEGGLYQWAKLGFNELTAFLVAWNLWLFAVLNTSETGLQVTQYFQYILPSANGSVSDHTGIVVLMNVVILTALVAITILGLDIGKWVHKAGGALLLTTFALLLVLPWLNLTTGTLGAFHPLATAMPAMTVLSFNIFAKMGFGALGGFEYVAIHAGECHSPERSITRSVWFAAPIICVMFVFGTSSVLALVRIDQIDLIAPIPQVLSAGFAPFGAVRWIAPAAILALLGIRVAQASVMFAGNTRLPMVAGWDGFLPAWFTRLHPRRQTPANSILFVGAVTLALSIAGLVGVGRQEAFQLLWNASAIFYGLTYLVMFAVAIVGVRSPLWLKVAAASGFLMTLAFVVLSILPIISVESRLVFALKISTVVVVTNAAGMLIYLRRGRRRLEVAAGGGRLGDSAA
jgi:amino acid transporter